MSEAKNVTFKAHLFANGLPLVLNYQVMEQRLKLARITTAQRLNAQISMGDEVSSRIITLADHDDVEPLLIEFAPDTQGRYSLTVKTAGRYFNWQLRMDQNTRHLLVDENLGSYFELQTYAGKLQSFNDLPSSPASVGLVSVEKKIRLFQHETKEGLKYFLDRNPNDTKHNAYNPEPVSFVLRTDSSLQSSAA